MNPQHIVPTIDDRGFILWESRAINIYLLNKFGTCETANLLPNDLQQRATVERLLYFDIGTLYTNMVNFYKPQFLENQPPKPSLRQEVDSSLDLLDTFLSNNNYVAGTSERSLADLSLLASISALDAYEYDYQRFRNVAKWVCKLKNELPYYYVVQEGVDQSHEMASKLLR